MGRRKGSITVFLSLTGILIVALLGTLLETARYTVCANHAARTTRTAVEGLLSEYNRPLYDHYGLFFLESCGMAYEKVIAGYIGDTFEAAEKGDMDFLTGELRQLEVTEKTYVGDREAAPLQEEIVQYMARSLTKKQLNKFLKKSEDVSTGEQTAKEIEDSVEEQKEEAELDEQLIELMKLIDGISVSSKGKVSCAKQFVKMFVVNEKKGQDFGITESLVWKKMKKRLDDTPVNWDEMNQSEFKKNVSSVLKITEKAISQGEKLRSAYNKISGKESEFSDHNARIGTFLDSLSVLEGNKKILAQSETLLNKEMTEEDKEELKSLWKDYDTTSIVFDYTGVGNAGGGENPLDALSSVWSDGILNLVCEDKSKLSKKSVSQGDNYAALYNEQEVAEDYGKKVTDLKDEKVSFSGVFGDVAGYGMDEFSLDSYIQNQFSSYRNELSGWKRALSYQWEYAAAGKSSDRENLDAVLNRILIMRTVVNFAAIYKDSGKKAEAYAAAAAIVGFTGLEPLIRLTQTMILIVWSLVEGLVDVAGLLQGRDVPLVKSSSGIKTGFSQIFQISGTAITARAKKFKKETSESFGYKDYLMLFLATTKQSTRRYRIMDLIQWDMVKNGYGKFDFGSCVFSVKVSAAYGFPSRFFRMSAIEKMLGRNVQEFTFTCESERGYL